MTRKRIFDICGRFVHQKKAALQLHLNTSRYYPYKQTVTNLKMKNVMNTISSTLLTLIMIAGLSGSLFATENPSPASSSDTTSISTAVVTSTAGLDIYNCTKGFMVFTDRFHDMDATIEISEVSGKKMVVMHNVLFGKGNNVFHFEGVTVGVTYKIKVTVNNQTFEQEVAVTR